MLCDVFLESGNKLGTTKSNKQLAGFPFSGGVIDAPVQIFEMPQSNRFDDFIYVTGCIIPGDVVLTDKGWKTVESVRMSDRLVCMDGEYHDIECIMILDKLDYDIYEVKMSNTFRTTTFTKEHPLWVSKSFSKHGYAIDEDKFEFDFTKAENVSKGYWTSIPNIYRKEIRHDEKCFMNLYDNSDFWWMIGLWLGDGCFDKYGVLFSINKSEKEIIDRLDRIFTDIIPCKHYFNEGDGCVRYYAKDINLVKWIISCFGYGSTGKIIPEWVKYMPHKNKWSIIHGYLDSDGSIYHDKRGYYFMEFVSVNLGLLESIQSIFFSLGIVSNLSLLRKSKEMAIHGRKINAKEAYHLRLGNMDTLLARDGIANNDMLSSKLDKIENEIKKKRRNSGCFISKDGDKIYLRIKKISKRKYTGPVFNFTNELHNYLCMNILVANCDPYKQAKSDTPSLGAFYVFKRRVGIRDPYAYRIVASYVSRPSSIDQFCRTCEVLQKGYGAICLMENADQMYEQYLNRKSGMPASFFLFAGEAIANKYVKAGSRQNSKLGLYPTPGNQNLLFSCVVDYCWQDFVIGYDDQTGLDITVKGIELIDDIALLDEIIQYKPGLNVDRIIAFGHALVLARYFDDNNYMPKSKIDEMNNARKEDAYKHHEIYASAFGSVSIGAFR